MTRSLHLLLVEDEPDDELLIRRELHKGGLNVETVRVQSREEFVAALDRGGWDLIISDFNLPGFGGMEALSILKRRGMDIPFILTSGTIGEEVAVESIKAGADDYLLKQSLIRLVPAINRVMNDRKNRRDRQASEQALQENRERLELIFQTVSDFLVFHTRTDDGRWVYTSVNRTFTDILARVGISIAVERLLGRDVTQIEERELHLDPNTLEWLRELRQEAVRAGKPVRSERVLIFPGGSFVGEFTYIPIRDSGGVCRHLLLDGRDVTELRRAEEHERKARDQIIQSQKMDSLGTLAGGIAHDFNNLLTGILGFADLAKDAPDVATARQHCDQLIQVVNRSRELVGRVLTFSRQQSVNREPVSLAAVAEELLPLLRASFPKAIEIVTRLSEPGTQVMADAGQLHQVILNLCTNASHAMPNGGRLSIAVEPIELSDPIPAELRPLVAGPHVKLTVTDSGVGMNSDTLQRLFEPFFTTKPVGHGTGLGLSVVHGIVHDHRGTIRVTSTVGRGTTFDVYFPVTTALRTADGSEGEIPRGRGERVLCLDDDHSLAELSSRMLAGLGYRTETFTDPVEAFNAFAAAPNSFAAVLTDNRMPTWSGVEFARKTTQIRPDLPVVIVTGLIEPEDHSSVQALQHGFLLEKPYSIERLARVMTRAIARENAHSGPSEDMTPDDPIT